MKAYRQEPLASRGPVCLARRSKFWVLAIVLVAGLELAGTLAVPAAHGGPVVPAASPAPLAVTPLAPPTTHGDLNVSSGTYYIPSKTPPPGPTVYYQGGNITVQAGAKLIIQNTTLVFVEFVGTSGTPQVRLSHVFHFVDDGTVIFRNSTLTTSTTEINPYVKLNVFVDGVMSFSDSKIETPGFLNVGNGGNLTLNESSVSPNPDVANMSIPNGTRGDFAWAPTLSVQGTGVANLFSSVYHKLYADNLTLNGTPNPLPLASGEVGVWTNGSATSHMVWTTPTTAAALTQDFLYPNGIAGGTVTVAYNDSANPHASTTVEVTVTYAGTPFILGNITLVANHTTTATLPFTLALTAAINKGPGNPLMAWLNRTGDFGTASGIGVTLGTAGPSDANATVYVQLEAPLNFGMSVNSGGDLNTVNTFLALNFSGLGSYTWYTHELMLTNSSTAYLANLTVQGDIQNGTEQYGNGAITADLNSHAYLFRWADISLVGKGGALPVQKAIVTAPYAYGSQIDNQTAQTANELNDPILGYVDYLDSQHGVPAYGESGVTGIASLLLASNVVYGGSAPDGDFLGDYHVIVTPPTGGGTALAFNWSVRPYPLGVANGSSGYGIPDSWGTLEFPLYYADVELAATNNVVVTADNVTAATITIGQYLNVTVNVVDNGPAPITNLTGLLYYNSSTTAPVNVPTARPVDLFAPGQTASVSMTWKVNETVVGLHGRAVPDNLSAEVEWNGDVAAHGGGSLKTNASVQFAPSRVRVTVAAPPPTSLSASSKYFTSAKLAYNGTGGVTVEMIAYPVGGGSVVTLFLGSEVNGSLIGTHRSQGGPFTFDMAWNASKLKGGTSYHIAVTATYNGVVANDTLPGTYSTPGPSAASFLFQKILGLPLWLWLVIVAAIVGGVVGFLLFSRRQAAGKLVECGECGNLVPEASKVCPKCGAEFESDVVRCSRCSSTIPASSQSCPECAAQLLGKPGEAGPDPERQAYGDFTERFRAEAKKELGENYSEGAFWDWWKRQPSYTPFSQWKVQQGQGTPRSGMTAPPPEGRPPSGGAAASAAGAAPARRRPSAAPPARPPPPSAAPPPAAAPTPAPAAAAPTAPAGGPAVAAMKPCPNCGKEIPSEYLVCPFCASVTQ